MQTLTCEVFILCDAVIEHFKGSGFDVLGTEDGQRVLDMANVDGDKVAAVGADGKEQTYEDGMFEQMVESGVLKRAQKTEEPSEAKVDLTDNQGNPTPQTDLSAESKGTEQSSGVQAEVPQVDVQENAPMPMRVVGKGKNAVQEEDWLATTPKRGHDYVFKDSGLDAEEANAFVENKVAEAEKNLEKVKGKAPKMGTNIAAYKEAKADYEARVAEAQKAVDYWHAVKAERDKVLLEERRARKEKDKALYDDAVAQEEQRKAEMAQKAAEQEALGSNAVAPAIKEKWENAPKVDGGADEITLPNGEVVTGHYVLTESGAASASHQATNGFAETEGYPVDVNGETVNDRDYKRDAEAQQVTRGMAADYDSRALQSPVVVSGDGVVLSGNGRTMAGEIAALNGSDAKYNAYLRGHAGKFGFTTEQVEGFEHPRVVFVPDGEMPYTSETFAKFNQREQKSQSRTEMAVKLGKVVDDALFGRVMDVIGRHESLAEFYADDAATASVVKELADAGVIPQTEMAQLFDGGRLSESGQAMVEGVLVGKVFQGSPDAVRQITEVKSMRKAVMAALPEVVACHRLGGGYDLSKELAAAVDLVYKARKAGFKLGQHVSQHARQGNLFQLDDGATVADYNNAAVMMLADVMNDGRVTQLKKVLSFYNTQAADSAQGIGDMFAGGVKSKGQIINEVNELLNNGQEYDRRTPSVADGQGVGGEGGEQGDVAGPSHQGGEGSERGLSEAFDGLAAQLKTAEGEERKRVLGEMRDGIARFAEENGYPVPEFLLTRDDFLAAVPEKDRAKYVEMLEKGMRMPAYYENKKVYYFVEGCDNFDKDVAETLAHEYTHADNAEFPENVNAIVYAVEDTHEVSQDELVDILEKLSDSTVYEEKAEQLEAEGKNANPMLADEVIAHSVGRMVVEGEQALDGITKNPTLQFFIKRAYKERENERQHNLYSNRNAERADKTVPSSGRNSSDNEAVAGGIPGDGQLGGSSEGDGHLEGTAERGRSVVSGGKEVAAPSLEGAKVGVTDGEESSATGDVVPSGEGDTPLSEKIVTASAEVNTEPTEAQKEAGNYKKGHVQVGTFDITIEQPQGSVRKGTDADGKQWESKMNNTYGYIRGAVGVDGDHIDVFLSNDIDSWNGRKVFVVDQYNPDGSFDEHKVMLGFNDADEAKSDYLANYENGWENGRRIDVTAVNLEDFEKWIASSKRKTKPFGEYSSVKNGVVPSGKGKTDNLRQQKAVGKSAQPPTREESILRDVVIEHMKGSGLDVIGTEDGQRVLDMVNEDGAKEHRVYHGSGAEFDHFDHSHMGEGEGAQAYGWGTYVTEVRGIGEGYAIRSKNGISMSREEWSLKRSELESNIYRAKEQLPFLKGEYKAEVEAQISEWEEQLKDYEPHNYLYTVEIPDDNGGNYLDWNGPVPAETIDRITEYLREKYGDEVVNGRWLSNPLLSSKGVDVSARNGAAIYRQLERALGSDKKASLALAELGYAGIKYPAEFRSGGRKDDAKNYVIFNENDAEITDHVRFFKTKNGEAYGFTVGGKIYYDPRIANAETPVHEYAHLWASALKANNAKEWNNVVDLMKGTNVWEEVKKTYPELETDDEIADEVLATYSGRRGAERLREEMRKAAAEGDGVMGKAEAVSALQRVKRAIDKFWKAVADFLHIHYTSAEEVADRVMKDLLDGVDPRKFMGDKAQKEKMRYQFMGEKGAGENVRDAEDYTAFASRYGVSADMVKDYALGMETGNLQKANFALTEIRRTMRVANRGMKLSEFGKLFRPVQKELAERYGDIEVLRQEYIDAEMRERGVMEAARKRAEEEAAKRKARADELRLLPEEELDRRYFEAVERGDDAAAREMLDEAARRKGYGDTESEYQGVGAWVAPSNPGYETDEARRDAVGEDSPNLNVEDMAAGYSNQPEDIFVHPDKYSQGLSTSKESGKAIQTAIDDIRNGKKEVKIKVYRAVPTSVKESKLRNGDWVTPSKEYAEMHGNNRLEGKYRIIEDEVPAGELWWDGNDVNEWGFDDGNGYKYKNVENSRKLNDLVTRDDNGEIIAPSKRFDENVEDVRYRTSEELGQEYGSRWIDEQTNEDGRHTTQVKNTLNSYKKFGDWVKRDSGGRNVDVLDASSGLGLGTEWLRENGINVEDVEPYPSENRTAPTYISYGEVKKKYDYIISNAVLNVIPDDWRANVLHNMAEKLKVGGKLVINVRSAESIRKQGKEGETRITLDDPSEILVLRPNGSIKAYQKGFTKAELKEWCEKELGKGYSVEIANDKNAGGSYDTAVVVTKNNESGTIGVASEASHPRRSAQAAPNSSAKLGNNQKIANNLSELSEKLSELSEKLSERGMGAHEFLFNVARAFGLDGNNLNKSFYQDLSNSVGIRISDHSASTNNIYKKNNNDEVYGLVVKLSNHRFKSRDDANYLEYVYYPDKLTDERQREIVGGLRKFLQTGDYALLPLPDRINRSGNFEKANGEETSDIAKHQAAIDLATDLHVEGGVEVLTTTEGLEGKKAKAKGWFDPKTGRVVVVLPNNKNVKDVRETIFHEVVVHKGVRSLVGDENFNTFLDNIYANAEEKIQQSIDDLSQKYGGDKRKATEEYMAGLSEDGEFAKPENQSFFRKVKDFLVDLLRKVGIKLGFKLTDNDLRYILWRSWKNLKSGGRESLFDKAEDVVMQHELGQTDEARSASGENGIMFREGSDELKDVVEKMKADVERLHEGELDDLRSGARAIGGRLSELNKAMRLQRAYDMSTVASVTELAKTMLKNGLLSEMSDYDVRRLLSVVNNVHGKGDIRPYVQKVVDMMVGNRLRNMSKAFDKLLAMRGKKVDARGVEVQGELDLAGQRMADVVWKGIGMSDDDVADMCADAQDRMMSANGAEAAAAATDYAGWQIVMRYNETIRDSKSEEVRLREDLKRAKEDYDAGRMTREAYMEFRESTNDAIRENRIERAEAYEELYEQLGGAYGESIKRAADFKAAEKARVLEIQHNANSDMEGRPARSYRKDTAVDKVLNSSPVQLLFAPLGTFDQMLRMFGSKNVKGEGYLWNRYMRGWLTATENEYTGYRDATAELDAKAAEVLGKGKTWADLFALERKLPKATVRVWDNGEMRELELPQGNLLYIYMVDKMADGRMKLRKMGVTEDDVAAIEDFLDPRLKEIGDWLQEVYLVEKRGKYNEVHERMFGAAMASIDNYFPLKILKDARAENVDVGVEKRESEMASTITGSVVKRTRNALALDLLNSDAFSVVLDHLQQMEHWSAFAEWNRDLNTLLSYKHFRNQVKNMRSAYGSGERLWEAFDKVARIAAGTYTPPKAFADKLAVNIAKGVTAAKISLRVFTALKQFTSFPAYLSDSNPVYLLKGVANPYGSWKWCMENLPLFEKRWKSRMAGDPRLLKNEMDWSLWRDNVVQMAAKWGMTPNGFVDALTVCIGARAMYETRRRKYIRYGYGLEEAGRRAKQDASILYNQTQQSSEGAFLSALQVDRSWYSVLFTVFRNSSMSYTRQLYAALRNTGRRIAGGAKFKGISEAFMAKQMERDGIDPDKASKNAKAEYRKSWINDFVRAGVFGYVLQLAWNCGPYALYMLFGDDEKKGKEMWHDIWTHTAFGSVEGLTGGDVWSAGLQSLWNHYVNGEDFNANSVNKDMPLTSDLLNVVKKVGSDNYGAVNDVLNLLVQAGFGVNPQTLTDAAVAIYDYCGSDVETTKECALLVMRVMNCPQSQMDNIYFDEIDATGEEAKAMSLEEIAERYARYKALRSAPLRALSSDALKAAEKKPRERVLTEAKEQLDGRLMTEEAQRYLDEYEATKKKVTETRALADTDPKAFMQQMPALARSGEFRRYRRVGLYKSEVDKLTKKLLRTSDPAERRALFGKMLDARDKMLKQVREME